MEVNITFELCFCLPVERLLCLDLEMSLKLYLMKVHCSNLAGVFVCLCLPRCFCSYLTQRIYSTLRA